MKYIPVIGMEVHCELKTKSKMFCRCKNGLGLEKEPNIHICPVCTGQPGAIPVPNRQAIEFVQKVGLALGCRVNLKSKFDRKNYFYPDLPKGYQISQYDEPLVEEGSLEIDGKRVGITRVHMEEDTGKSQHDKVNGGTLVDLNRSSVPLMELVTEPDIESGEQARKFCQKLQQILRYLSVSDADMEKGQMRCEANISLHKKGQDRLSGTKVEVKNLNSFRSVERAIVYEIKRQTEVLDSSEQVVQETRGWDDNRSITFSQRKKESAHDYRYFPEPDIPPMEFTPEYVERLRMLLPEMPDVKRGRFILQYGIEDKDAEILVSDKGFAEYFERVMSELDEKKQSQEIRDVIERARKLAVNYSITELRKHLIEKGENIQDVKITPENFAELIALVVDERINSSAAQTVLAAMYETGDDPDHIIAEKNLAQTNDAGELEEVVEKVLEANKKSVADYRAGKQNALQYLMGQVMKETQGKANPGVVMEILKKNII